MGAVDTTYTFTATDTITSAKMNNIIDQTTITADAIIGTTLDVASGKLKIRSAGITSNEMGANSVVTAAITDSNVTTAKIADSNVTTAKIADANVTTAKIADANVTTAKIADANVTQSKLAAGVTGNGPAFRAVHTSSSVISTGQPFKFVTLSDTATNTFDTNSNFASSSFAPTIAGYYQINGNVSFTAVADGALAAIYKNGSIYSYGAPSTSGGVRSNVSDIVYLNGSTDYVNLYVLQTSGSNKTLANDQTFLSGCLIRSA